MIKMNNVVTKQNVTQNVNLQQTKQNPEITSTLFILNIFSSWCLRWEIMHFCILETFFFTLFTKYIRSIQLIKGIFLSCCEIFLDPFISKNKQFFLAFWPLNLKSVVFRFGSICFSLVIYFLFLTCISLDIYILSFDLV